MKKYTLFLLPVLFIMFVACKAFTNVAEPATAATATPTKNASLEGVSTSIPKAAPLEPTEYPPMATEQVNIVPYTQQAPIEIPEPTSTVIPINLANYGPEGGIITSLMIDFSTPTILYAGTQFGRMFKSTDGGENWIKLKTDYSMSEINTLAIDPITPSTIYAGASRLYKSTDQGENWSEIGIALPDESGISFPPFYAMVIDPISPTNVYLGTNMGVITSQTPHQ